MSHLRKTETAVKAVRETARTDRQGIREAEPVIIQAEKEAVPVTIRREDREQMFSPG